MEQNNTKLNICSLDDDTILEVMKYVPHRYIPRLRLVCTRFDRMSRLSARARHSLLLQVGHDRRQLTSLLWQLEPFYEGYARPDVIFSGLRFSQVAPSQFEPIIECMPNITSLKVIVQINDNDSFNGVLNLLEKYAPRLVTFKLIKECSIDPQCGTQLIRLINASMPALRHLYLDAGEHRLTNEPLDLPILRQLHLFHFGSGHPFAEIAQSLRRYGESNGLLQKLESLKCHIDEDSMDVHILDVDPRHAQLFTVFHPVRQCTLAQLNRFTSRFTSLTQLNISITGVSLVKMARSFAPLTQLAELHLNLLAPEWEASLWNLPDEDSIASDQIAQLTSVRRLTFMVTQSLPLTHYGLISHHFGWIFPNLQLLSYGYEYADLGGCSACVGNGQGRLECIKSLLEPWVEQCPYIMWITAPGDTEQDRAVPWRTRPLRPLHVRLMAYLQAAQY